MRKFSSGDTVKMDADVGRVGQLQKGHGGFNLQMAEVYLHDYVSTYDQIRSRFHHIDD